MTFSTVSSYSIKSLETSTTSVGPETLVTGRIYQVS